MVAKSLAVGQSGFNQLTGADPKYNWLFNDDETPRQEQEPPLLNESGNHLLRQQKYLVQANQEGHGQANSNLEQLKHTNQRELDPRME